MAKKEREHEEDELMDENDTGGSHVYELGFHLDPELSAEEVKKAYQSVREVIEKQGALVAEGEPEKVPLAYTISRQEASGRRDFDSAYFSWIAYETSAQNHEKVLEAAREESRIIRFLDVITTKDIARHAAEMRLMAAKTPSAEEGKEGVSDADLEAAIEEAAPAPGAVE